MRNLGGAVGLAGINTVLNDRTDLHLARLHEQLTWAHLPAVERLDQLIVDHAELASESTVDLRLGQRAEHVECVSIVVNTRPSK